MIVPDNIKQAIKECAEAENKACLNERIIMRWLKERKLTEETASNPNRDMTDSFINYCKMTCNPDEFIEVLENLDRTE